MTTTPSPLTPEEVAEIGNDHAETWWICFRRGVPFAAFVSREIAEGYRAEAEHRKDDTISARRISFKGMSGYTTTRLEGGKAE